MFIDFVYFYKNSEKENILRNSEKLTNVVLEFFWENKVKLANYPSYDFMKKEAENDSEDMFIGLKFKDYDRIWTLFYEEWFYFETFIRFFEDSYYIKVWLDDGVFKKLWETWDEIEEKIISFNKKIIEENFDIEAIVFFNEYWIHNLNYNYSLSDTKEKTEEVKEWITNVWIRKDDKIIFEKWELDFYWEYRE